MAGAVERAMARWVSSSVRASGRHGTWWRAGGQLRRDAVVRRRKIDAGSGYDTHQTEDSHSVPIAVAVAVAAEVNNEALQGGTRSSSLS